jgi:hypothetical protein
LVNFGTQIPVELEFKPVDRSGFLLADLGDLHRVIFLKNDGNFVLPGAFVDDCGVAPNVVLVYLDKLSSLYLWLPA